MKINVYSIFDVIGDCTVLIGTANTDSAFIRQNLPYLSKINPNFLNDFKVSRIGEYVESTNTLVPCDAIDVPWTAYDDGRPAVNTDSSAV